MESFKNKGQKNIYQIYIKQVLANAAVLITDKLEFGVKLQQK